MEHAPPDPPPNSTPRPHLPTPPPDSTPRRHPPTLTLAWLGLACRYALYQRGNSAWDVIFGDIMPEAIEHIRWILNPPETSTVEFGHNSHELISRLISIKMEKLLKGGGGGGTASSGS